MESLINIKVINRIVFVWDFESGFSVCICGDLYWYNDMDFILACFIDIHRCARNVGVCVFVRVDICVYVFKCINVVIWVCFIFALVEKLCNREFIDV